MDVLGTAVNFVLVALTLVVIWYARKAVRESREATEASRETVTAVRTLLAVAQDTASSSQAAAEAARQTVEVAKVAREGDERARLERQLRDIGELAEQAFWKAAAEDGRRPTAWRCVEQQYIAVALMGVGVELPKCRNLAGSSQAGSVMGAAVGARDEIAAELRKLHASSNG